jgi:ATP-dependent protease ClpP protease subunit
MFAGTIDTNAVARFTNSIGSAVTNGVTDAHLLFQSPGGIAGDGVCLYNLFRGVPLNIVLYNAGTLCSAAAIAFLGAKERKFSAHATFMLHRSQTAAQGGTAIELKHLAHSAGLDDARAEAIIRESATLTDDQWEIFHAHNLWLSAQEAFRAGIATEIAEFAPPRGEGLAVI